MPASDHRLTTQEMADFVVDGYLRFDALIPKSINKQVIEELSVLYATKMRQIVVSMGGDPERIAPAPSPEVERPESLTPLSQCYPEPSVIGQMLRLPEVQGIIESLVGSDPLFDHDFVHFIPAKQTSGQHLHVDAVIDNPSPGFTSTG